LAKGERKEKTRMALKGRKEATTENDQKREE
jgi:hypothetical protein